MTLYRLRLPVLGLAALALALGTSGPVAAKGGGTTTPPVGGILPTTPPAPGVLLRESFGFASLLRPAGGRGEARSVFAHQNINSFWLEYLGSKSVSWLTPDGAQAWRFAACSDDPNEMPSPLQVAYGNGCVVSEWPTTSHPTALVPFRAPAAPYEVSIDGYPASIPGGYLAVGLTSSNLLASNLETSASVWLVVYPPVDATSFDYPFQLRTNGLAGPVLGEGTIVGAGFNPLVLAYDPIAHTVSATGNGQFIGPFPLTIADPRYVGFEGVGVLDNFVVRLTN